MEAVSVRVASFQVVCSFSVLGNITSAILHHPCPCCTRLVCQCSSSLASGKRLFLLARIPNSIRLQVPKYSDSFKWLDLPVGTTQYNAPVGRLFGRLTG